MIGNLAARQADRPYLRVLHENPEALKRAAQLLRERNLPAHPLELTPDGEDNHVILGPSHVVRLRGAWPYDQRKDVAPAARARALGARAPACLGAGENWSIWERFPGTNHWRAPQIAAEFWRGLGQDLARLHAMPAPTDAPRPNLTEWYSLVNQIPNLPDNEIRILQRIMNEGLNVKRLTFAHGDVHGGNIIVAPNGSYGGLVDWTDGGWWPPEQDYAQLDSEGLNNAIDSPFEVLDWSLVTTLRVGLFVRQVHAGFASIDDLREALGLWELMR